MEKIPILLFLAVVEVLLPCDAFTAGDPEAGRFSSRARRRRYLGLSKRYKLNRRYQECVAPGDAQGHCKHLAFCPMDVLGSAKVALDYLCIIEKTHVGVCCPDDIIVGGLPGSLLVMDLPAGALDYDEEDSDTGCGLPMMAKGGKGNVQRWPWIASLYTRSDGVHFCGGAILTERHVLTAAHCTDGQTPDTIVARLGEYDYSRPEETRFRDFRVQSIKQHEEYQASTYTNDISIVTLSSATSFNTYIWPVCLPPFGRSFENATALVAGWGQNKYLGPVSKVLLQVEVPVWPQGRCEEAFLQRVDETNLCAAAHEGGRDSCLGDSGGPLVTKLENGRWAVIGVVSWGIGCGEKSQPGIYTRVNRFLPWIVKNTIAK